MATLTNLIPTIVAALSKVPRHRYAIMQGCTRDSKADSIAVGQTLYIPRVGAGTVNDITAAATLPDNVDHTVGNTSLTISNQKAVRVNYTGEEQAGLSSLYETLLQQHFADAFNQILASCEADLANIYKVASRAVGTPGTTPFAMSSGVTDLVTAELAQILDDNGAPDDRTLAVSSDAVVNLRKSQILTKANEAGSADTLRRGALLDLHGFSIGHSSQILTHTIGTEDGSYLLNDDGSAIGDTTIALDGGSGTIVAGDFILNQETNRDPRYYGVTTALSGGSLVIAEPGLRTAWTDDDSVENTSANFVANVGFARSAVVLATRVPKPVKDLASDKTVVTDPETGIAFEIAEYPGYQQARYEVRMCWGYAVPRPEFVGVLFG